jgi:Family of unknown function (DUF6498)
LPKKLGGLVALLLANLFVAFQAVRHEWGFYEVMLVFWIEVVILGFYNVLRLMVVGEARTSTSLRPDEVSTLTSYRSSPFSVSCPTLTAVPPVAFRGDCLGLFRGDRGRRSDA